MVVVCIRFVCVQEVLLRLVLRLQVKSLPMVGRLQSVIKLQQILELWKLSYSMEEIAETLGFSSPDMARKAKYRCHVSLLEIIRNNPHVEQLLSR